MCKALIFSRLVVNINSPLFRFLVGNTHCLVILQRLVLLVLIFNFLLCSLFFQGKISVADMIAFSPSEVASAKYDGNHLLNRLARFPPLCIISIETYCISLFPGTLKYWESSITLVNILKNEIRDGQLSFRGKRVLEVTPARNLFSLCSYFI